MIFGDACLPEGRPTSTVSGIRFVLYPTEQNKTFQVSLAPNEARTKMLERIVKDSLVSDEMRQSIKSGEFFVSY